VVVDQFSGKVLDVVNSRMLPAGHADRELRRPDHVGTVLGSPTVILAFLGPPPSRARRDRIPDLVEAPSWRRCAALGNEEAA
jgi:hypothetical protein